jgi:hypothetical protein
MINEQLTMNNGKAGPATPITSPQQRRAGPRTFRAIWQGAKAIHRRTGYESGIHPGFVLARPVGLRQIDAAAITG